MLDELFYLFVTDGDTESKFDLFHGQRSSLRYDPDGTHWSDYPLQLICNCPPGDGAGRSGRQKLGLLRGAPSHHYDFSHCLQPLTQSSIGWC